MENEELTLLNEKPERKKDEIASPDHMTKEISSSTDTSAEFWAAAEAVFSRGPTWIGSVPELRQTLMHWAMPLTQAFRQLCSTFLV
jgi:hypothetical protein